MNIAIASAQSFPAVSLRAWRRGIRYVLLPALFGVVCAGIFGLLMTAASVDITTDNTPMPALLFMGLCLWATAQECSDFTLVCMRESQRFGSMRLFNEWSVKELPADPF